MSPSYLVRLAKGRALKFISHHDLARTFERMLRRSGLPFELTKGYHRRPKISFSPALPLGLTSNCELAVISLSEDLDPEEVRMRLEGKAPRGLKVVKVERDGKRERWLFSQNLWAEYVLNLEFKEGIKMKPEGASFEALLLSMGGVRRLEVTDRKGRRARFRVTLQVVGKGAKNPREVVRALEGLLGPVESAHICRVRFFQFSEEVERGDEG